MQFVQEVYLGLDEGSRTSTFLEVAEKNDARALVVLLKNSPFLLPQDFLVELIHYDWEHREIVMAIAEHTSDPEVWRTIGAYCLNGGEYGSLFASPNMPLDMVLSAAHQSKFHRYILERDDLTDEILYTIVRKCRQEPLPLRVLTEPVCTRLARIAQEKKADNVIYALLGGYLEEASLINLSQLFAADARVLKTILHHPNVTEAVSQKILELNPAMFSIVHSAGNS